jgi:hypothetical protein
MALEQLSWIKRDTGDFLEPRQMLPKHREWPRLLEICSQKLVHSMLKLSAGNTLGAISGATLCWTGQHIS